MDKKIKMDNEMICIQNSGCQVKYLPEDNRINFIFPGSSPENFKQTLFESFDIDSVHINSQGGGVMYGINIDNIDAAFDVVLRLQD